MSRKPNTIERMLAANVDTNGDCWLWKGSLSHGYGLTAIRKQRLFAHRAFYAHFKGAITNGHVIYQTCRNRLCVNPDHLEEVTPRVRTLRGNGIAAVNARKTVCIRGHALDGANLQILPDGRRQCIACQNIRRHLDPKPKRSEPC